MRNPITTTWLAAILALGLFSSMPALAASSAITMVKNTGCVCCERWAAAMQKTGFDVTTQEQPDITAIKDKLGVPQALRSCHTATAGGYIFEGHVPPDLVAKVLKTHPKIAGLAVPGMPLKAPGMDAAGVTTPYQVIAFTKDGQTSVYAQR
ncbi:DUF411 domain-containing protein [Paludibacterium purpuratum]|uniref:CopG family transcriptional regulator n=1 Tax=Paludibacterium purpuratum TaxID=1144873 RepID=A0A4R7B7F7_9NEIS|nr:DUF411 domain-containing protein [Paludibacterium purpuratum]TDR80690.1 hypothetical protein DFP86_104190 [Paludibacterium purpuratum]